MLRRLLFGSRGAAGTRAAWDLGNVLLNWSKGDAWTIGDAVEGTLVTGATGSGKSSGSGRTIAKSMLAAGFGGLVLTAKKDELAQWQRYARETRRERDLMVFGHGRGLNYNFLNHELHRPGEGAGLTENILNIFSTVLEVAERGSGGGGSGHEEEGYWRRACRQLLRNLIDLAILATGRVAVPDLYRLAVSAPTSFDQLRSEAWKVQSYCFQCLEAADRRDKSPQRKKDFEMVTDYFCLEFPGLSDKTRSVIVSTFTSMIDVLNRGVLRDLFCGETNVDPTAIEQGKILIIDLPVKEFAEVGQFAQVLWKYAFQRSVERRDVNRNPRPVFLWADEAQHFVTSYDQVFQTTCRAARVATVYLTQNMSNFEAAMGGNEKGKAETASLFANLNTKVLHANGDPVTNQWAASLVGRTRQVFINSSNSCGPEDWTLAAFGLGHSGHSSAGFSESYEFEIQPGEFSTLRTGGPTNKGAVDAIVFQNGRRFRATGRTWMPVTFLQGR